MAVEPLTETQTDTISIRGVGKRFTTRAGGSVEALRGVDLRIRTGEFVSLVGRSGCGKSTLLNLVGGLIQPSSGTISVKGEPVTGARNDVGYMQQDAVLLPWRSVRENLKLPMEVGDRVADTDRVMRRIDEMLEKVHLSGFRDSHPWELSGGMQQRVALVRTLAYEPRVLLMDEPFGSLDEFTREAMNLELLRLWQGSGITVILVTHSAPEAVFLSDRVVTMSPRPGQIIEDTVIDLPRPRTSRMLFSSQFTRQVQKIRDALGLDGSEVEG